MLSAGCGGSGCLGCTSAGTSQLRQVGGGQKARQHLSAAPSQASDTDSYILIFIGSATSRLISMLLAN